MQLFPSELETISGTTSALIAKKISCREVVEHCLAQIDACEEQVRAWVRVDREAALALATQRDCELQSGQSRGPLHGIPLGIKDIIDVAGYPTGCGSRLLEQGQPAATDAALVLRLRQAGAIILGKTVTTEFACFDPPVTRNPWNAERTPGGSSSGSAAAVAAGMCLAAIGSQTGGSITRPSAFCGVCGCKPSLGAVSKAGMFPLAESLDHPGPIARSVADLARLLEVISGNLRLPGGSELVSANARPPRIGRLRGLFEERAELEARQAHERALRQLASAGATVVDVALPAAFDDVLAQHKLIMARELATLHAKRIVEHPEDYLPRVRELIEVGSQVSPEAYHRAAAHRDELRRQMQSIMAPVDIVATPAATGPAPDRATTGDPSFNAPWSFTGQPTVSFPIALSKDGLPLSLQLTGAEQGESGLFAAALWCERAIRNAHGAGGFRAVEKGA